MVITYALPVIDDDIPNTFGVALRNSESDKWKLAIEEEMKSFHQNQTWELVKLPKGKISKNRDEIERLKKQLASEFEMKDLSDAQRILGMKIHRDKKNGSVWLTQKSYLKKVLERFGMDDKTKLTSIVGSLMYVMICTKPDISQGVSMVSSYMHNSGKNHWLEVKWILRYLYRTVDVGLLFKKDYGQQCIGYCDFDFAGDLDKRRSTTGYVFTLGRGPISWRSIPQSTIALSTTEAEYMAATEVVKEAI
ncbi:secreted RxLR effector protein 161-like [Citrus sinensis]|uniref:secreted RxLR effector protein 161-like n=1 Tax=Citrus sinensis TaxID=2711 RepID=UPI002279287D|nr:secreted RxLR effector protein 161-like [Citrus sinensis]